MKLLIRGTETDIVKEAPGCGTLTHAEECLCDVVVKEITPINYGLHELQHADLVIKYKGLGAPWNGAQLAQLLDGLDRAREAVKVAKKYQMDPNRLSTFTEPIKDLLRQGHSMVDVPDLLGITLEQAALGIMSGRRSCVTLWNEANWLAFEADVADGYGRELLARRNGLPQMSAKRLADYYRNKPAGSREPALRRPT